MANPFNNELLCHSQIKGTRRFSQPYVRFADWKVASFQTSCGGLMALKIPY